MKFNYKNILTMLAMLFVAGMAFTSCSDDDDAAPTSKVPASAKGTWTDSRDGHTYHWVRYGNTDWMADNFKYNLNDEGRNWLYGDGSGRTVNVEKYGYLYTYQGAVDACPDGWRLPTDEDWQKLEMALGMSSADAAKYNWRGNIAKRMVTLYGDSTDLNLMFGGYYNTGGAGGQEYGFRMGALGYYWTASVDTTKGGSGFYFYREFIYNSDKVFRQSTSGSDYFSVRYVRDE